MTKLDRVTPEALQGNPRATLAAWQKYEQIVIAAMALHPKSYVYPCSTLKPATVCSRLRDAVRGKIAYDYPSTLSTPDVTLWFEQVIFKFDNDNVYIGPPQDVKDVLKGETQVRGKETLSFPTLTLDEVIAFSVLLSGGKVHGPVYIHQPPDISQLPERPNLEILKREDGSLVLI